MKDIDQAIKARPYQEFAIEEIRRHFREGRKKVLLMMPTGSGKTFCFSVVLKGVLEKGNYAIMLVKGKDLVDQASQRLFRENTMHGCRQGNHWNRQPHANIQICSIDTLARRQDFPRADMIVIDECHYSRSPSFEMVLAQYPNAFILAVSATPHHKKGLRHIAEVVVNPIKMKDLIAQGYLVPARYFVPGFPDMSGVKISKSTGDYETEGLLDKMDDRTIYGDMIKQYREKGEGRPGLIFAVCIEHSLKIMDEFNRAGIKTVHIEANTPDDERRAAIADLERGDIKLITNVGILTTGVDVPCVSIIIMARPTKSYNLFVQILGRGTRPYPGKKDFIVLDHAGTVNEHGFIEFEKECNLDGYVPGDKKERIITCPLCFNTWSPSQQWADLNPKAAALGLTGLDLSCLGKIFVDGVEKICTWEYEPEKKTSEREGIAEHINFEMIEITSPEQLRRQQVMKFLSQSINVAISRGLKPGWVFHQIKDKYGEQEAKKYWKFIESNVLHGQAQRASDPNFIGPK